MQNHGSLLLTVLVHIGQVEFCRQAEIQLTGRQGVLITYSGLYVYIQLRSVECSFTDLLGVLDAQIIQNLTQSILRIVPHLIIIVIFYLVLRISQRQDTSVIGNTEILVGIEDQVYYLGELGLDLLRCYEQMGIILAEMSASFDTLQGSAGFETEVMGDLTDTDRQILVGVLCVSVDHHVVRAVHGTQYEGLSFHFHGGEHVLLVVIPVTGSLVQIHSTDTGGHNMQIAQSSLFILDIILQLLPYGVTLGKEHGKSAAYQIISHEQFHFLADLSVVTLFGLFQLFQMCFQFLCGREADTIDTLHYVVVGIALPVYAGVFYQFEVLAQLGVVYVRSTAQIGEITLIVYSDVAVFQIADQIQLVHIILEHFHGFCLGNFSSVDFLAFLTDLLHLFFDGGNHFIIDYIVAEIDIIIESFLYHRSYPEFCMRIQMLDSLCHDMGTGMIQSCQSFVFLKIYHFRSPFCCFLNYSEPPFAKSLFQSFAE